MNNILFIILLFPLVILSQSNVNSYDPKWSPDGERVVFYSNYDGDNEIYIINRDGKGLENIYFNSKRLGNYQLFKMKKDGSDVTRIFKSSTHQVAPSVMNNENKLVYTNHTDDYQDFYILNLDNLKVEQVTNGFKDVMLPSFSPNDKEIVFVMTKEGKSEIYIMEYKTKEIRKLTKL